MTTLSTINVMHNYTPLLTITNEHGETFTYTPMTEEEKERLRQHRKKSLTELLKEYEENKDKFIPRIYQRNVEWFREELNKINK